MTILEEEEGMLLKSRETTIAQCLNVTKVMGQKGLLLIMSD